MGEGSVFSLPDDDDVEEVPGVGAEEVEVVGRPREHIDPQLRLQPLERAI